MIHERFILAIDRLRLKQIQLAHDLGLSAPQISLIKTGKRKPSKSFIKIFCLTYNINEKWLVNGTGEMIINDKKNDGQIETENVNYSDIVNKFERLEFLLNLTMEEFNSIKKILAKLPNNLKKDTL